VIAFGGEVFPDIEQLREWMGSRLEEIALYNLYGITEVSSWAFLQPVTNLELQKTALVPFAGPVPLGRPLPDTDFAVYRSEGPEAHGESTMIEERVGELWIGGKFRTCLLDQETCGRVMRRTGDLVYLSPQGELFFVGRIDNELKVFGKRVLLEEIENALNASPEISNACVVRDPIGAFRRPLLRAFVVPRDLNGPLEGSPRCFFLFLRPFIL